MRPRLYQSIGGLVLLGIIAFAFVAAIGESTNEYNTTQANDEQLESIKAASAEAQNKTQQIRNESKSQNFLVKTLDDVSGGILSKAIGVFQTIGSYLKSAFLVVSASIGLAGLPRGAQVITTVLTTLLIVVLVFVYFFKMYFRVDI